MRREQDRIDLKPFAKTLEEASAIRVHLLREKVLWRVLVPMLVGPVLACLLLIVLDAFHAISPMRDKLLTAAAAIVGGGVVSTAIGAGFGWLYKTSK